MAPMTVEELKKHPEFPHVRYDLTPNRKGTISVAKGRGGPLDIAYEVHGHGPKHLVWIMGLGSFQSAWQRQTKDLGHAKASQYTCLLFDNRGMGGSGKPLSRYSTSEMAKDTLELVDHLGWTEDRELHVIGVSMGGMIAQELALMIPNRIGSLTLVSTAARLKSTVGYFENLKNRINMFIPKSPDDQLAEVKTRIFSEKFLDSPDDEWIVAPFPNQGDRFAALDTEKRMDPGFTRRGFMLQAIAAGWHHKSPEQLKKLGDEVGRGRIQVFHGVLDKMLTFPHGEVLLQDLGGEAAGVGWWRVEGVAHVISWERRKEFNEKVEAIVAKADHLST